MRHFLIDSGTFLLNQMLYPHINFQKPIKCLWETHFSHLFHIFGVRSQTGIPIIIARWTAQQMPNPQFHNFPQANILNTHFKLSLRAINVNSLLSWVIFTYILSSIIISTEIDGGGSIWCYFRVLCSVNYAIWLPTEPSRVINMIMSMFCSHGNILEAKSVVLFIIMLPLGAFSYYLPIQKAA